MGSARNRAALALVLTFILGAAGGALLSHKFWPAESPFSYRRAAERYAGILDERLQLNDGQHKRVEEILRRHSEESSRLVNEARPRFRALTEKTNGEIEAVLSEDQLQEFRAFRSQDSKQPWTRNRARAGFAEAYGAALALTDAQKQQIKDIEGSRRKQSLKLAADSTALLEQMRLAQQRNDRADVEKAEVALRTNRMERDRLRQAEKEQILGVLTEQQRVAYQALQKSSP